MATMSKKPTYIPRLPKRLSDFDRVVIDGVPYRGIQYHSDALELVRDDASRLTELVKQDVLDEKLRDGRAVVEHDYFNTTKQKVERENLDITFQDLTDEEKREVIEKQDWCDHILRLCHQGKARRSGPKLQQALLDYHSMRVAKARAASGGRRGQQFVVNNPPSVFQFRRWLRKYEKSNYNPMSLYDRRPLRSGNITPRHPPEVQSLLKNIAEKYISSNRPSVLDVYLDDFEPAFLVLNDERMRDGLPPFKKPRVKSLERQVAKLSKHKVMAGRFTEEKARKINIIVNKGLSVTRPLERVEMDEWEVSLQTLVVNADFYDQLPPELKKQVQRTRVWLTAGICCATRVLVSFVIQVRAPSAESATECLKMIVVDKTDYARGLGAEMAWSQHGRPESLFSDNGSALIADMTRNAGIALGCEMTNTPVGEPELRARIERVFGTIGQKLLHHFTGRTFSNVTEKGPYEAGPMASITVAELIRAMTIYVVDQYHLTPHEGLLNETPFDAWNRLVELYGVLPPPSKEEIRHIFGLALKKPVTNEGITVCGLQYQSDTLMQLHYNNKMNEADVKIDTDDISCISVRGPQGLFTVPCMTDGFEGISMLDWVEAYKDLQKRHTLQAAVYEDVVLRAVAKLKGIASNAVIRGDLPSPIMTATDLDRLDRELFRPMRIQKRPKPAEGGILDDVIGKRSPAKRSHQTSAKNEVSIPSSTPSSDTAPKKKGGFKRFQSKE